MSQNCKKNQWINFIQKESSLNRLDDFIKPLLNKYLRIKLKTINFISYYSISNLNVYETKTNLMRKYLKYIDFNKSVKKFIKKNIL